MRARDLASLALLLGCSAPGGPDKVTDEFGPPPDGGLRATTSPDAATSTVTNYVCTPATSAERMPSRSTITTQMARQPVQATMFTADLFGRFAKVCGGCHVQSSLGGFTVSGESFKTVMTERILNENIVSDDPKSFMPPQNTPNGMPYSSRPATDPVVQLAGLLRIWIDQGRPGDVFVLPQAETADESGSGYLMSDELGAQLTNIGSCVPNKDMVGVNTAAMDRLDAFFAQASELPATLAETDLSTLDSETLAKNRVISYAPTYPLWTDSAGKMRYVRVPRGQAITFDKATQRFQIPAHTRFYKTFLKPVVDANGKPGYRKIETRMIVSRPDKNLPDGTVQQTALYGTYVWNEDESQATLLNDPLVNQKPFSDRLMTYIIDESKAQPIIQAKPPDLEKALTNAGVVRHYALPGAVRCVQCHMGSPSESFVLGFTPLQVARHPMGVSGVIEPAVGDELSQLQRFIDYGVIAGMTSPADVLPLDKSQGTRAPRNPAELTAQAYMLGNCSHCHNPRGFPSSKQPALKDVLDFLPSATGGIFQFPLDRVSPVRKRGLYHDVAIPYITPSIYDLPSDSATDKSFCPDQVESGGTCGGVTPHWILAPWRSLIYRNVDTPYDYFDDYTPFPHMPLDSPGYDCRITKILGDWMVGIPAKPTDPTKREYLLPGETVSDAGDQVNLVPQPFTEVLPGDPAYAGAVEQAQARLQRYHTGYRYGFCPGSYTADIVDPVIADQVRRNVPVTTDAEAILDPRDPKNLLMSNIGVPVRPNWVNFDDTDPPGDWFPRRPDWEKFLVHPDVAALVKKEIMSDARAAQDLTNVLEALETIKLTPALRSAFTEEIPFGLWDTKIAGCDFGGVPRAKDVPAATAPEWMTITPPAPDAPVFVQSPGAAVFTTICYNCHGVQGDAKGLLADEINVMTGGAARVANFRDGLFGPLGQAGANRDRVFGEAVPKLGGDVTADDVAARYMAWMALGGTTKHLPQDVLIQVSEAPVLGELRHNVALAGTPDMLKLGLELCSQIVTSTDAGTELPLSDLMNQGHHAWSKHTGLIESNADAEMWLRLCSLGNRPVVRAVAPIGDGAWTESTTRDALRVTHYQLYWGAGPAGEDYYGANPVMDHRGRVQNGIGADNWFPLCVQRPKDPAQVAFADKVLQGNPVGGPPGKPIPYCPEGFVKPERLLKFEGLGSDTRYIDAPKWAARGAINAALAVFLYLDAIEREPGKRKPLYNQCNLLGRSP